MKLSLSKPWRYIRGRCASPLILTFDTRWWRVVKFMPELLYFRKKPWYLLSMRLGGLQSRSWCARDEKNLFLLLQFEPQITQPVAQLQYWLRYTDFFTLGCHPTKLVKLQRHKIMVVCSVQPCDPVDRLHCCYWCIQISSCIFQVRLSCTWTDVQKHKILDSGAQKIYFSTENFNPWCENLVFDTVCVWREWFVLYLYINNYDKYIGRFCCHFSHKWQLCEYFQQVSAAIHAAVHFTQNLILCTFVVRFGWN